VTLSSQGLTLEKVVHSAGARRSQPHRYAISLQGQTLENFVHRLWMA
jgi:hypothetical protein